MAAIDELNAFSLAEADVSLWVFKGPTGPASAPPTYSGRWIDTTDEVDGVLRATIESQRGSIEEVIEYGLLAQNNEASALSITTAETHAGLIVDQVAAQTLARKVSNLGQIRNSAFYVIKLIHGDTIVHAVRKTGSGWRTKNATSMRSLFFADNQLALDDRPRFDISSSIDFFIVGDEILVPHKGHFESILRYKQAHKEDFLELQQEEAFSSIFVDMTPLATYVGDHKIHLRRVSAIRQKGLYLDAQFMARLRQLGAQYGFTFQFDPNNKIIVTPDNCAEVITALLDHRLSSAFSTNIYDVPSTVAVVI
jgi:hypothetical protein